jgi:hypothetical protein
MRSQPAALVFAWVAAQPRAMLSTTSINKADRSRRLWQRAAPKLSPARAASDLARCFPSDRRACIMRVLTGAIL